MLQRFSRPGPATGAGMGAEPTFPAYFHVVVILVVPAEHLLRDVLELLDNGEKEATRIPARGRPDRPVEEFHHPGAQVMPLLPGQFDGEVGYFLGGGSTTARTLPLPRGVGIEGGRPGEAPFADYE